MTQFAHETVIHKALVSEQPVTALLDLVLSRKAELGSCTTVQERNRTCLDFFAGASAMYDLLIESCELGDDKADEAHDRIVQNFAVLRAGMRALDIIHEIQQKKG